MKVFNKEKYLKVMKKIDSDFFDLLFKKDGENWFDKCDGKEVINHICGSCIVLDDWCVDIEKENKTMKKKIRDLTKKEYREWELKNCSGIDCLDCPFKYVNYKMWVNHKDMYSNKFLDQEVEVPSLHILDKQEHDYLRAVLGDKVKNANLFVEVFISRDDSRVRLLMINEQLGKEKEHFSLFKKIENDEYKQMELDKHYSFADLELDKEWKE